MDQNQLGEAVEGLLFTNQHEKAMEILIHEFERAKRESDTHDIDAILSHLVFVCAASDPPKISEGRRYSLERENNIRSAYNALQTALFEYYTARNYRNGVEKLQDARIKGEQEGDSRTVYSALGHLGRAFLEAGRTNEAVEIIREIEQMLSDKKPFVVGDETVFLEGARDRGIELQAVRKLAAALAPLCHDSEFKRRLEILAS